MNKLKLSTILTLSVFMTLAASAAFAMTAPTTGNFGFELYDIGVNKILKGPVGMTGGVIAVVGAAILAMRQMVLPAVGMVLAAVFLLNAESFLHAVGAVVM